MIKYEKTNIFLIIGYLVSVFAFSLTLSNVSSRYNQVTETNKFYKDYNTLNLVQENIDFQDEKMSDSNNESLTLLKTINTLEEYGYKQLIFNPMQTQVEVNNNYYINDIWPCSAGINIHSTDIIKGRYFTNEELDSNEKLAVIGSGLERLIEKKAEEEYIKVFNEYYKVIGVINNTEVFKYSSIIPLKSLYFINEENPNATFLENSLNNTDILNIDNENLTIHKNSIAKVPVIKYLFKHVYELKNNLYQIALGLINLLLFSYFFSKNIKSKVAIMRILGAKNIDIFKELFTTFIKIASFSLLLGLLLTKFTVDFMSKAFISSYSPVNIENIILTSAAIFLVSSIVSICVLFNVIRFKIMKEIR